MPGFVRLRLRQNYRSPFGIARFMHDHLPFDFEPANPLPGLGVGVHGLHRPEDQVQRLAESAERLGRLLFCGMGRATVRLDLLVKAGSQVGRQLGLGK